MLTLGSTTNEGTEEGNTPISLHIYISLIRRKLHD